MDICKLRPKEELVIILDDLDLSFYKREIKLAKQLWIAGVHIEDIARRLRRNLDEVALLVMHMRRQGMIRGRQGGVLGNG